MNSYGDGNTYRGTVCKDSEVPTIITDGKTAYTAKDYPIHSSGPWSVTAGIVPDREGRLLVEDRSPCHGCPEQSRVNKCAKDCAKRQEYVDSFKGKDLLKAVDIDDGYRILPM